MLSNNFWGGFLVGALLAFAVVFVVFVSNRASRARKE